MKSPLSLPLQTTRIFAAPAITSCSQAEPRTASLKRSNCRNSVKAPTALRIALHRNQSSYVTTDIKAGTNACPTFLRDPSARKSS
jgi:hypothetical protein